MSSSSAMGVTPRFTPRGARELIDDIDLLLDHLGRAMPGRLEACFDDSRGSTARGVGVADPPQVPPADGAPAGSGAAATGRPTKAAFVGRLAEIARRAANAEAGVAADGAGEREAGAAAGPDAAWKGFAGDLAFLIQARDFLGTLAQPATVDTIRLTRAYIDQTTQRRKWWGAAGRRGGGGGDSAAGAPDRGRPAPRNHAVIGAALAGRMARLRLWCVCCVWLTLVISLYAFTGKSLLDDGERTRALLGKVNEDIAAAVAAEAQDARVAAAQGAGAAAAPPPFGPAYCDQPFLDDDGVVRYASARQETLCNRLWGVNAEVNRLNRHLDVWGAPIVHTPLGALFGVFGRPASANAGPPRDQAAAGVGAVRVFAENARRAGFGDALRLASEREREAAVQVAAASPGGPAGGRGDSARADAGAGAAVGIGATDSARAEDRTGRDPAAVLRHARQRFAETGFAGRESLLYGAPGIASPPQVRAVIEGVGLYVMPCLYALLGAFVAVFRNVARKGDALLLDPFDHDRATQAITLGVVFGAVVGLLADMLKGGAAGAGGQPAGGATVALGVSALALLSGYSAGQVFGLLDDISERVFGRRDAPGRAAPGA